MDGQNQDPYELMDGQNKISCVRADGSTKQNSFVRADGCRSTSVRADGLTKKIHAYELMNRQNRVHPYELMD